MHRKRNEYCDWPTKTEVTMGASSSRRILHANMFMTERVRKPSKEDLEAEQRDRDNWRQGVYEVNVYDGARKARLPGAE